MSVPNGLLARGCRTSVTNRYKTAGVQIAKHPRYKNERALIRQDAFTTPLGIYEHITTHIENIPVNTSQLKLASENGFDSRAPKICRSQVIFDSEHGSLLIYRLLQRPPIWQRSFSQMQRVVRAAERSKRDEEPREEAN